MNSSATARPSTCCSASDRERLALEAGPGLAIDYGRMGTEEAAFRERRRPYLPLLLGQSFEARLPHSMHQLAPLDLVIVAIYIVGMTSSVCGSPALRKTSALTSLAAAASAGLWC